MREKNEVKVLESPKEKDKGIKSEFVYLIITHVCLIVYYFFRILLNHYEGHN